MNVGHWLGRTLLAVPLTLGRAADGVVIRDDSHADENRLAAYRSERPSRFLSIRCLAIMCVAAAPLIFCGHGRSAEGFLPQLTALDLAADQLHPGETLDARYEFVNLGTSPADGEHVVFVHLRPALDGDPDVGPATGADFRPLTPTFAWLPRAVVREDRHPIRIPGDFPPGRYHVLIGLYEPETGQRQNLANDNLAVAGQRYRVATVEVLADNVAARGKPIQARWRDTAGWPLADAESVRLPAGPVTQVDSGDLKVTLSSAQPRVLEYELAQGPKLLGDSSGYPLRARICRTADDRYRTVCLRDTAGFSLQQPDAARYSIRVCDQEQLAASFALVIRVQANVLEVRIESVKEESGYLLMDVWLPQLVSVRSPGGQLVVPTQSGRLVHLDRTAPGQHSIGLNWFEADLCGAVIGDGCAAALRTRDWDNELEARVSGAAPQLAGGFSVRLALRAEARGPAAKVRLAETPGVELAVVRGADGSGPTWIDAAKWLRRDVAGGPNPLYQDTYIYKIFCDAPGATDFTTFEDALGVIRRVHELAPWLKQVVYLVGWQYQGHDTGYPATDQINERLGGLAGLRRAAVEAAKYNAILSYHDNFDDAYRDSPRWDETLIARDSQGGLQRGGVWAGGQSYIIALDKYARQAGLERIRRTVGQMPVRDSYHIDVLSAVPMRRDYHPQTPESTRDSLAGKFALIREFNRLGIDVTSEGFTAPFVGVIGHSWHLWRNSDPVFAGEEPIPFIPLIYHGGPTTYGRGNPNANYPQESSLYGATYSTDWTKHVTPHEMAEPIYLVVAPWTYLRHRRMQDYQRRGSVCRVVYAADTFVEVNEATGQWRVVVDGTPVVEDGLVVVRRGDLVAVYAQTERRAKIELPPSLRGARLRITNACTGKELTTQVEMTQDSATMTVPARDPVLIRAVR